MMDEKCTKFARVLGRWDIIVIAFGAMIGWGWVVSSGSWIEQGGVLGAAIGFLIGGTMIFFVGYAYAELTSAMPKCGGEQIFSYRAMGGKGSFICTWALILGYISVVCFESCTLPLIFSYIYPDFLQGYLYSIGGFDIYATWIILAVLVAVSITYINIRGVKMAARLQSLLTLSIGAVGLILVIAGIFLGDTSNLDEQMFVGNDSTSVISAILAIAMISPFFLFGFDVIPQVGEEINVSFKKVGRIMLMSIILAVAFYISVIICVGLIMDAGQISTSMKGTGLVTADALAIAFNSTTMAKVVLIGGLCGIVTSWNSFIIGGSRAIYSMAKSNMIPSIFGKLHSKYKTPYISLIFIGLLSCVAPLFGRQMLIWIVDAGNLGCCMAYFFVVLSFLILRKKEPDMLRPYKVKHYKFVGAVAAAMSGFMIMMYMIPGTGVTLVPVEWAMIGLWILLGILFAYMSKKKYGSFKVPDYSTEGCEHLQEIDDTK